MSAGPLRTFVASIGLIALVPIAWMVVHGDLAPVDAGIRAAVVLGAVLVVGRIVDMVLSALAASLERRAVEARIGDRRAGSAPAPDRG